MIILFLSGILKELVMLNAFIRNLRALTNSKPNGIEIENIRFGLVQDLDIPTYIRRPDLVAKCNADLETNNQSRGIPK